MKPARLLPLALLLPLSALAGDWQIIEQGTSSVKAVSGKPWFQMRKRMREENGEKQYELLVTDDENKPLSEEHYSTTPDGDLKAYHWKQYQYGDEAFVEFAEKTIRIRAGAPAKLEEKVLEVTPDERARAVVPPMLPQRLAAHRSEIEKGKEISLFVIVPDRLDGFNFRFTPEKPKSGFAQTFTLRAVSFFLSLAIAPMPFHFRADGSLGLIEGIQPPVKRKDERGRLESTKTDVAFDGTNERK